MASARKQVQQLARQLFRLSVVDGEVSAERVAGVLSYVEKNRPSHPVAVLRAYQRLISAEVARSRAVVDHAGPLASGVLESISTAMTRRYGRRITSSARRSAKEFLDRQTQEAAGKAADLLAKAQQAIELEHRKMLADARAEVARLVVTTTERVLARKLSDADRASYNEAAARELSGV